MEVAKSLSSSLLKVWLVLCCGVLVLSKTPRAVPAVLNNPGTRGGASETVSGAVSETLLSGPGTRGGASETVCGAVSETLLDGPCTRGGASETVSGAVSETLLDGPGTKSGASETVSGAVSKTLLDGTGARVTVFPVVAGCCFRRRLKSWCVRWASLLMLFMEVANSLSSSLSNVCLSSLKSPRAVPAVESYAPEAPGIHGGISGILPLPSTVSSIADSTAGLHDNRCDLAGLVVLWLRRLLLVDVLVVLSVIGAMVPTAGLGLIDAAILQCVLQEFHFMPHWQLHSGALYLLKQLAQKMRAQPFGVQRLSVRCNLFAWHVPHLSVM